MASLVTLTDALITRIATITALTAKVHYWAGSYNELYSDTAHIAPFAGVVPVDGANLSEDSVFQAAADEKHVFEIMLVAQDVRGSGIQIREGVILLGSIRDVLIGHQLHADASPLKYLGYDHDKEYEYSGATVWRMQAECQQVEQ